MPSQSIVLVTGSTDVQSIGFEVATQLALGDHGFETVIVSGRNPEALSSAVAKLESLIGASSSVKVDGLLLDVSSASSISSAVSQLSAKYGRIDVLVNNAGVSTPRSKKDKVEMFLKTEETEMDDMMEIFQTNVAGVVELTNKMIPLFRGSKSPKVVNVSSARGSLSFESSLEPARTGAMVYNTSKAALNMVTIMQSKNLPAQVPGILVNAASPGHVSTPFNKFQGQRTVSSGAGVIVHLATLPDGSKTGGLYGDHQPFSDADGKFVQIPW